jgi:hypothetical protein
MQPLASVLVWVSASASMRPLALGSESVWASVSVSVSERQRESGLESASEPQWESMSRWASACQLESPFEPLWARASASAVESEMAASQLRGYLPGQAFASGLAW